MQKKLWSGLISKSLRIFSQNEDFKQALNMNIQFKKDFRKQYKKLSPKLQKLFQKRFLIFQSDPFSQILNNHTLAGKYKKCRSINVSGDLRAIYTTKNDSS